MYQTLLHLTSPKYMEFPLFQVIEIIIKSYVTLEKPRTIYYYFYFLGTSWYYCSSKNNKKID